MISLLRQTLRRLLRERGFTVTVVATLALCIGANVTIYTVFDQVLVRPLPFPLPAQLVTVFNSYPGAGAPRSSASITNYYDRRNHLRAFTSLSVLQMSSVIIGGTEAPHHVEIGRVSPEFFETLGVSLARGKMFGEEAMIHNADRVAVITDSFWRSEFNADPNVLGRQFSNDGIPVTILGVLPSGFRYLSNNPRFFRPASHSPDEIAPVNRHDNSYQMIARLAPGVSVSQAQVEMSTFAERSLTDDPNAELARNSGYHVSVAPLHADHIRDIRAILFFLQGGALTLLLIGLVNLFNLLLIRAHGREKEFAVRQALGAGRRHLLIDALAETIVLTAVGSALGATISAAALNSLHHSLASRLPFGATIAFDLRIASVAVVASLLIGGLLGLALSVFTLKFRGANSLQSESRSGTASRSAQLTRYGFIVAQVALAHLLVVQAGLLGLSLHKLASTSLGFEPDQVLTASLSLPWKDYKTKVEKQSFVERLKDKLASIPGVTAVGFTSGLPFAGEVANNAISVEGQRLGPGEPLQTHFVQFAFGDYWKAVGIPLLEGRVIDDIDNHREHRVCVVDSAFAQRYWPAHGALDRWVMMGGKYEADEAFKIVGVVGSIKPNDVTDSGTRGTVYFPYHVDSPNAFSLVLRTRVGPESLLRPLRGAIRSIDPGLPLEGIQPLQSLIEGRLATRRSPVILAGIFAAFALILAAVGTYGVLAYTVSHRRREIGIRMALGALPHQVLRQFLRLGLKLLLVGIVLGALGSWFAAQATRSLLFGVNPSNLTVPALAALALVVVGFIAVFIPSRRATKISPLEALRAE